jgi:hypothetical protein
MEFSKRKNNSQRSKELTPSSLEEEVEEQKSFDFVHTTHRVLNS